MKAISIFLFLSLTSIFIPDKVFSYGEDAHLHIASQALTLFELNNPLSKSEYEQYASNIRQYSIMTDYQNYTDNACAEPPKLPGTWDWCDEAIMTWRDHFWNPDDGTGLIEFTNWTAKSKAESYWGHATNAYNAGNKTLAYQLLGSIAHLLGDMALPAHVLNDPHLSGDTYEDYMESHYANWNFRSVENIDSPNSIDTIADLYNRDLTWEDLFLNLAQRTQYFPSDDRCGNSDLAHPSCFTYWYSQPNNLRIDSLFFEPCSCPEEWSDIGCHMIGSDIVGEKLMPLAIQYTAALYKLFWSEFHIDIEGPSVVESLSSNAAFKAVGKINGNPVTHYEWDFNYDGTFEPDDGYDDQQEVTLDPLLFKGPITKTIAVRINDESVITKSITVKQIPINVDCPDGYESLHRHFSTSENSLIQEYTWNYGDGSPEESGSSRGNTFPAAGYYTVTLTLTLCLNRQIMTV